MPDAELPSEIPPALDVLAALDGDDLAFARLVRAHTALVRLVVRDHVRAPEDVADCVQETFARALRDLHRLQQPTRFRAWLRGIARHVAIDHRRRTARDACRVVAVVEEIDEPAHEGPDPAQLAALRQLAETIGAEVRALPPREARALALADYQDLPADQVAARLGVTSGNARVIVHRARRRLRSQLVAEVAGATCLSDGDLCRTDDRAEPQVCEPCRSATHDALRAPA